MFPSSQFNPQLALELANLIKQAYTQLEDVEKKTSWQLSSPYQLIEQFYYTEEEKPLLFGKKNVTLPFGFIATQGKNLYIVFRGTSTPLEWIRDAQLKQVDSTTISGKTTLGFSKIYNALSPSIHKPLADFKPDNIIITGHSLGGALANLCMADLLAHSFKPTLYTFAAPRTVDPVFAQSFKTYSPLAYRIFNTEDIVPALPVATLQIGDFLEIPALEIALLSLRKLAGGLPEEVFEHIGEPISFTDNKKTIGDNHNMKTYIEFLKSLNKK